MDKSDLILAAIEQLYAKVVEVKADVVELKADVGESKTDIREMNVRMDRMEADQKFMKQTIGSNHLQVLGRINQLSDQLVDHIRHHV